MDKFATTNTLDQHVTPDVEEAVRGEAQMDRGGEKVFPAAGEQVRDGLQEVHGRAGEKRVADKGTLLQLQKGHIWLAAI